MSQDTKMEVAKSMQQMAYGMPRSQPMAIPTKVIGHDYICYTCFSLLRTGQYQASVWCNTCARSVSTFRAHGTAPLKRSSQYYKQLAAKQKELDKKYIGSERKIIKGPNVKVFPRGRPRRQRRPPQRYRPTTSFSSVQQLQYNTNDPPPRRIE